MKKYVIIPSATIVSEELQSIGKLPAIIYPLNKGIVFDYLYKQYNQISNQIEVVCFEKADKVHRRLENYQDEKIKLIDLPRLDDLGHTIYHGLKDEHIPAIINFADTIVFDNIYDESLDSFYYAEDYVSEQWTYFDLENGKLTQIFDKVKCDEGSNPDETAQLFVGVFQISDSLDFKNCLQSAFENRDETVSSFYQALKMYSESHPLIAKKTNNWFDIGHIDKYYNSKLEVKAREFNHITIDKNRGILTKYSDDKDKFIGEIKWYLKLPADIEYVSPRIFDYSTAYSKPYISMEYYAYHTVHELFLYGDLGYHQWVDVFKRIQFICADFKRYSVKDDNIQKSLEDMYLVKTMQRFEKMKDNDSFLSFFSRPVQVNGRKYKSLDEVANILKRVIPDYLYDVNQFNIIHGDLCFANMMVDNNFSFIKVIDPRGKFGAYDIYGDYRYELAKLFHSVDGKYDFIIKDLFKLDYDVNKTSIQYRILDRKREFDLFKVFLEVFKKDIGDDIEKIELIEALLFLSMIPLHGESIKHQMVMLATGLDILNRVIDITVH